MPAVYSEARRFIEIDDWDPHAERHYRILIDGLFKLGDSKPPTDHRYLRR